MTSKGEFLSAMISGLESLIEDDAELDSVELVIVSQIRHSFQLWQQKHRAVEEIESFLEKRASPVWGKLMNFDSDHEDSEEEFQDFGPCCGCGCEPSLENPVRSFVALPFETPLHGTGWGNVYQELPDNGAMAILCDRCIVQNVAPSQFIYGFAVDKQRRSISELSIPFGVDHDQNDHA